MALPARWMLIALLLTSQVNGKRRPGGSGGGSGDDSGGSGDGGDGGDSYDYVKDCKAAQAQQTQDLYLMPGSYYSGPMTITHTVEINSAGDGTSSTQCQNNDLQTKNYIYDAILAVGPVRDGNDTAKVFWSLQAYPPTQPVSQDARNEFVRIRSASYGVYEFEKKGISLEYPYLPNGSAEATPWKETFRQYWNTSLSATDAGLDNVSVPVNSWDISATYFQYPDALATGQHQDPSQPVYPHNFITLSDICYQYGSIPSDRPSDSPYTSISAALSYTGSVMAPTMFFDLGASIQISGIGTDKASLRLTGGRIVRKVARVHLASRMTIKDCEYDEYGAWPWTSLSTLNNPSDYSSCDSYCGQQNLTVNFELSFDGARNASVGTDFHVDQSTLQSGPQWSSASGVVRVTGILLVGCLTFGVLVAFI